MSDVNSLISSLSTKYSINTSKPHFPVNSMRLYYLLLTHAWTDGNEEAVEKTNRCIPLISSILDERDSVLAKTGGKSTPLDEFNGCQNSLEALFKEIDTPELRQAMQMLFLDIYPLQHSLLASIDQYLKKDSLSFVDLMATLKIRAMDSSLYASVIDEIVHEYINPVGEKKLMPNPLYLQINVTLRINDLVDAIVYAKQDLEANSATLIEIVKKIITNNPISLRKLVDDVFLQLHNEAIYSPNSGKEATAYLASYNHKLMQVVGATPPNLGDYLNPPKKEEEVSSEEKGLEETVSPEPIIAPPVFEDLLSPTPPAVNPVANATTDINTTNPTIPTETVPQPQAMPQQSIQTQPAIDLVNSIQTQDLIPPPVQTQTPNENINSVQ